MQNDKSTGISLLTEEITTTIIIIIIVLLAVQRSFKEHDLNTSITALYFMRQLQFILWQKS